LAGERDWEREFWQMAGREPIEGNESEEFPHIGMLNPEEQAQYEEYINVLRRKEQMVFVEHQVTVNLLQSKTALNAIIGLTFFIATILSISWSIYCWVK
jgi:hypothetical protein